MRFFVFNKKQLLFAAVSAAAIAAVCISSGRTVMTFLTGGRELPIYSVERPDNKVALTFDCAWNDDDIDDILDALSDYGCGATFFVTGKWAEDNGASLNEISRAGFEIGTHSYGHSDYTKMSEDEIIADTERAEKAVTKATGVKPHLMRAPAGAYNDTVVRAVEESGRRCIQWSVDGIDYSEDATEDSIYARVTERTSAGDVILLHNGTEHTAAVLPRILETLTEKYEIVAVSDLIYDEDYTIDRSGKQSRREIY